MHPLTSWICLFPRLKLALSVKLKLTPWLLWISRMTFPVFLATETLTSLSLSLSLSLPGFHTLPSLLFPPLATSCAGTWSPGEDLERNDGSPSRPYYMSAGLHKILRRGEEGAKICAATWAMCGLFQCTVDSLSLSLTSPYLLYVWGSQYCRAINQNWMHPARSRVDGHDGTLFSFSFQRKRQRGLEKDLCLLPVSRQLRCLPFFCHPLFFLSSFLSVFSADLSLTERVYVRSI